MSKETAKKKRRAYIGNLRSRPNLSNNLYNDLFIPHCLSVNNNTDGISVIQPKHHYSKNSSSSSSNNSSSSVYALVEFHDVDYAIQVLNGVQFDGRVLRVSKEKTNFGGSSGGGFGSSKWAGRSDFVDGGRSSNFPRGNRQSKPKVSHDNKATPMGNGVNNDTIIQDNLMSNGIIDNSCIKEETIIKGIESTISSEIQQSSDEITTAIACTAAMTLLSSVDAFGLGDGEGEEKDTAVGNDATAEARTNSVDNVNDMTNQDFQSRCKLPLSDLLSEYGEQDLDWMKHQPQQPQQPNNEPQDVLAKNEKDISNDDFQSRCQMPLSDLLAEYGEQDVDWKKEQQHHQSSSNAQDNKQQRSQSNHIRENNSNNDNNGMLAHFNKAFIHLELVSFGYKYGAPSHSKRGFTYTHPLPPIDVRDLHRCPGHVGKFNGLHYLVKKALLNPTKHGDNTSEVEGNANSEINMDNDEQVDSPTTNSSQSPMRTRANQIADEVIKILVESIDEGGHGPINPLTMTISIGSEYGRHRSVVLVEHLAIILRSRLRKNDGRGFNEEESGRCLGKNGIVKQPVSVSTRHQHVDARHTDEEAFGEDLKREERIAEKLRRRKEKEEEGWDTGSW